ncbi:phosphotransferase, partial [Roseomonas mucosa]
MSLPPEQRETGALLSRLTGAAAPLETHISAIYVGAERTLKLKKAVALSFLDFTGLEARERFCRRELEINAPAAPGIYHAVHAVTRAPGGPLRLDGDGEAVDWVLEMATLPADGFLNLIAARHGVDGTLADALGDTVAALHATQPVIEGLDSEAAMQRVLAGAVESCRRAGLPMPEVERLAGDLGAAFATRRGLLNARAAAGHVRRCHGDLHLGNLVLWPSGPMGRPVAFDALEFDEALATVDTGYDLAFLLMDLDRRASRAAANRTLSRYLGRTGDAGLLGGLAPWLSLRAMVRSYCEVLAGTDGLPYLHAARGYLEPAPPVLLAIGGLPGTGKSWLARALAPGIGVAPG